MAQQHKVSEKIKKSYPYVDILFGTGVRHRFPEFVYRKMTTGKRVFENPEPDTGIFEGIPVHRDGTFKAWLPIMQGCNNFCTYCIVPYVRGRERSRTPEAVIAECVRLQDEGAQEIMLLGQNVNSYRGGGAAFAELLYRIDRLGIPRIRFMTSHPKDLSDELIHAFGELTHLMPQLHLPVQAGSDEILKRMNRSYTREHYLDLVHRLRSVCPEIGLTSDIIVGFPGETLEQFEETMSLIRQVRFDAAYTFIYSPRKGTKAATYPDDTPYEVKSERIQRLIDLQQAIVLEVLKAQVGKKERVLVEAVSTRDSASVGGKTPRGHMVNFAGDSALIGQFADVEITSAGRNTLRGRIIKPEE
jgi:tRNA-2-methylthio-N6-dimethylallyladenosine synthase